MLCDAINSAADSKHITKKIPCSTDESELYNRKIKTSYSIADMGCIWILVVEGFAHENQSIILYLVLCFVVRC